jgi:hypothetical protein
MLNAMQNVAFMLSMEKWILRSGGAIGADKAFESGCDIARGLKEIYVAGDASDEAMRLAAAVHPAWYKLSFYAQKLHARNCFQVLGKDLRTPCLFIICWTPDGADGSSIITSQNTGGTGQAIRLGARHGIPIINMRNENWKEKLQEYCEL